LSDAGAPKRRGVWGNFPPLTPLSTGLDQLVAYVCNSANASPYGARC